jgi:hypothetical protein
MKKHVKLLLFLFIPLLFLLSACSLMMRNNLENLFELEQIDLSNKKYAMIFSANIWSDHQMRNGRNILLLIDDEGNWDAYNTYNLDRANINWTEDGLYFSDHTYEYFIDKEGYISKTNKTLDLDLATAQDGSSVDEQGRIWSWFDVGFDDHGGYQTRITRQYKGETKEFIVEGAYNYLFTVGSQLYGVSANIELENEMNQFAKNGLVAFSGTELTPVVLSSHDIPNEDLSPVNVSQQVAVNEDFVYVIGEAEIIDERIQTNLMLWNTTNGDLQIERIAVPTDHYSEEFLYYSYYTHQNALRNNHLYWFNERGELKKTNLLDFETEQISTFSIKPQIDYYFSARFFEEEIYMVVNDTTWGNSFEEDGVKMRIIQTSFSHPEKYEEFDIKDGHELAKLFAYPSLHPTHNSFAVRPTE